MRPTECCRARLFFSLLLVVLVGLVAQAVIVSDADASPRESVDKHVFAYDSLIRFDTTVTTQLEAGSGLQSDAQDGLPDAPSGLADDIIRLADGNLTGSGETVLGHYGDDYIGLAQQRGASYFDIGDAWDGLSDARRWAANQRVLDSAITNGDQITLATARTSIRYPSALADEIQYLTSNGYVWIDDVTLVPG